MQVGRWVPRPVVIYLEKVVTLRHTADFQLAGQPHSCHCRATIGQSVQDEGLVLIQVGLASMKNGLYWEKKIYRTEASPSL